jgi:hypothetical protein
MCPEEYQEVLGVPEMVLVEIVREDHSLVRCTQNGGGVKGIAS